MNELAASVTAYSFDPATGALGNRAAHATRGIREAQRRRDRNDSAATALYASNRGHDSIARFAIDPARLTLSPPVFTPAGGRKPRSFALDPTGKWLVAENQDSGSLVVFSVRPESGELVRTKQEPVSAPAPVGLVFVPAL